MEPGTQGPDERRLKRLEEALLVTEAQAGDSDAFVQLMNRYSKPLLYYLRRLVPEADSLDIHQEVWIDAFRGLSSLPIMKASPVCGSRLMPLSTLATAADRRSWATT